MVIKDKKQNKKICEDENIKFNILGTKIKFAIFIRTKNLFNPFIFHGSYGCLNNAVKALVSIFLKRNGTLIKPRRN